MFRKNATIDHLKETTISLLMSFSVIVARTFQRTGSIVFTNKIK